MWIEIFGAITGLLYVTLEVRQNRWLWPLGFLSSAVYIYVFFVGKFYADAGLQVYYVVISIYGWYCWSRHPKQEGKKELPVRRIKGTEGTVLALLFLLLWFLIYYILDHFTDSLIPLGDAFTTALAIVATWMLTRKIIEQWLLWIVANTVALALYIYKGLYPTALLYFVYTVMAVVGLYSWRRDL
ncbi:MAG: nicotinamide mononucleotide transporter [Bacteroidetes bacterium]|nr:MAG: nicotinamide mononucleotide transporter [Bacteroidota bacterium]